MHNGCILWGGVGTGKSLTSLAYFVSKVCKGTYGDFGSMRTPRDVYVITTAKKRDSLDWEKEAIKFGITTDRTKSISNIQLTVDSWNNIEKYVGVSDAFFIFDEQRLVGSGAWAQTFIKIAKLNEWVLLSATPGDTWLDYIPVFVANGWYKNRTEFKRRHVVYNTFSKFPKVDRYVETGHLVRLRNQILVHMPYDRHTVRHIETITVDYDVDLMNKVVNDRWHVYEERPLRDVAELFSVMRKVANSDSSRLMALRSLMEVHPRIIVFYNFDYELELLRTLSPTSSSSEPLTNPSDALQASRTMKKDSDSPSFSTRKDGGFWTDQAFLSTQNNTPSQSTSVLVRDETLRKLSRTMTSDGPTTVPATSAETTVGSARISDADCAFECQRCKEGTCPSLIGEDTFDETDYDSSSEEKSRTCSTRSSKTGSGSASVPTSSSEQETPKKTSSLSTSTSETNSNFAIAEWNGHNHDPIPTTDSWIYLVQYTAGSEGWNCIDTDAMAFFSLTYSYKAFHQAHGRIDRLNTPFTDLWYYILLSNSLIDKAVMKSLRAKKSFNESKLPL